MSGRPAARRSGTRIALVVDPSAMGGAERYVELILRHLPERFLVTLLATEGTPQRLLAAADERGAPVVTLPRVVGKADARGLAGVWRRLREAQPDLVHINATHTTNSRHFVHLALTQRRPTMLTLHTTTGLSGPMQRLSLRHAYRRLCCAVAVSEEIGQDLISTLGLPPEKVMLVANGVEPVPPVTPSPSSVLRIGAVGRLTAQKGFDVLIEAVRILTGRGADVDLRIAGDGPDLAQLRGAADGLPVSFVGFVDTGDFLSDLDAFCLSSRFEGTPLALLEAMMRALPCVATDVGDVRTVLGTCGVVVPRLDAVALADALERLAHSPDMRRKLGVRGRARALEHYTAQRMVDQTAALYERCARRALSE